MRELREIDDDLERSTWRTQFSQYKPRAETRSGPNEAREAIREARRILEETQNRPKQDDQEPPSTERQHETIPDNPDNDGDHPGITSSR